MQLIMASSSVTTLQNGDPGDYGAIPLPPSGAATALARDG